MTRTSTATQYERRTFSLLDVKALDDAAGSFEGYLAVFDNVDQGGDIIRPGAFEKTLADLQTKQRSRKSRYILPIFWSHLPEEPLGGFTEAAEDTHGLRVKGELDLDIEQGRRAYSGLKRGYLSGLSIGYITVKQGYEDGARVLKELRLLEGSLTAIPMNEDALVTGVKAASDDDKAAQEARAKKYGIGVKDGGNVTKPSEWDRLSDADFGDPVNYRYPMPDKEHADNAAARFVAPAAREQYSAKEQDIVAGRIMKKQRSYDEEPDWWPLDSGKSETPQTPQKPPKPADYTDRKARDFDTLFQSLAAADDLQDEWGDTFIALTQTFWELMFQVQAQANGWVSPDMPQVNAQEAAQATVAAFSKQVLDLVARSEAAAFAPMLDADGDQFLDPDGCNAHEGDAVMADYLSATPDETKGAKDAKAGRVLSAANRDRMNKAASGMREAHTTMHGYIKDMEQLLADTEPSSSDDDTQDGSGKSLDSTTTTATPGAGAGAAPPNGALDGRTTPQDDTTDPTDDVDERAQDLALKIQARLLLLKADHVKHTEKGAA